MLSAKTLGLDVVKSSASGEVLVRCPFHEDKKPSAWYNQSKGLLYCAVCGRGWHERQIAEQRGIDWEEIEEGEPEKYNLYQEPEVYSLGEETYPAYLQERGVSEESAHAYGVRWLVQEPQAVVFPMTTALGRQVGAVYRFVHPEVTQTRYKFMGKVAPLWPLGKLTQTDASSLIILTEGAFSALRLHSYGLKIGIEIHVFALMGAKANEEITSTLAPFLNPIFLYDADEAGFRARDKMRKLMVNAAVYSARPSPDDMSDRQLDRLLERLC